MNCGESPGTGLQVDRRAFVASVLLAQTVVAFGADAPESRQATGTRVGEITDSTAIVWTRLTRFPTRNNQGIVVAAKKKQATTVSFDSVVDLEGACPGMPGRIRLRYGIDEKLSDSVASAWTEVGADTDFIHQFWLTGLKPDSIYHYESETAGLDGSRHRAFRGKFQTALKVDAPSDLTFCVMTCQGYPDRGHPDGHGIYPSMQALNPRFACLTGDLVYYDNDPPAAVTPELASFHWQRMFSLPRLMEFTRNIGTYWLKDDHDVLINDSWPGMKAGELTFVEGQKIFRQQAPLADGPSYRTFRWGRDLQIWFTDGRDFRSPNKVKDGPGKTIWGAEQKAWFKKTVAESTATWKVLVSPTPLVGPDRVGKNDNHTNSGFAHEGNELREWLKTTVPDNFFVICGDRHWQYHSVHPETGLVEFGCGPASDEHAGGTPGENPAYHRFHRVKGGFLAVTLAPKGKESEIRFEHRDVAGHVMHEWTAKRAVS